MDADAPAAVRALSLCGRMDTQEDEGTDKAGGMARLAALWGAASVLSGDVAAMLRNSPLVTEEDEDGGLVLLPLWTPAERGAERGAAGE